MFNGDIMGFFNEQLAELNISNLAKDAVCCTFIVGTGIFVEGFKKLFELSDSKIVLCLKGGKMLELLGESLEIKQMSKNEISISGTIKNINVL